MSYWGNWKCPACGREWYGGIGWYWPDDPDEFDALITAICGCTGKGLTKEQADNAMIITTVATDPEEQQRKPLTLQHG